MRGDTLFVFGEPACEQCSIVLNHLATLGKESDAVSPTLRAYVARTTDGRFFAGEMYGTPGIGVYDSTGAFVRMLGRKGHGPGEFQQTRRVVAGPGDTLVVYDRSLNRFSFLAPNGTFSTSFQSPIRVLDFDLTSDGLIVASGIKDRTDPFAQGPPVHIIAKDGSVLRSVGDPIGATRADKPSSWARTVAVSTSGVVAIAHVGTYSIELVEPDGRRRVLFRRVEWFPPSDSLVPHLPQISNVWIDGQNRLWVTITMEDPRFRPDAYRDNEDPAMALRRRDTVVEVFDLSSGALIASQKFDDPVLIRFGVALSADVQPTGYLGLTVSKPTITNAGR